MFVISRLILIGCFIAYAVWAALEPITAADLWVGLSAGRWIVDHGSVPAFDPFSYTAQGSRWFNQEWLAQVLFYYIYLAFGGTGLALSKIAIVILSFALAVRVGVRRSGSWPLAVASACGAALLCRPFLDIRPQLFTFLGAILLLALIERWHATRDRVGLLLIPPLLALWANLHYGFIYGVALCIAFVTIEMLRRPSFPLLAVGVLAILAGFMNPQGWHAYTFPFTILGGPTASSDILEWKPPVLLSAGPFSPLAFWYYLAFQAIVLAAVALGGAWRLRIFDVLVVLGTAAMALSSRRFIPLFAFVSAPFLAANLALLIRPWAEAGFWSRWRNAAVTGMAAIALLGVGWRIADDLRQEYYADGVFDGMTRESSYFPVSCVEFLKMNDLPARVFNLYTWAGYLLFHLPDLHVFIDGRAHAVYPAKIWQDSFTVEMGRPGWSDVLDRYEVSLLVWPSAPFADGGLKVLLDDLNAAPAWIPVYDDGRAMVFAHSERGREWVAAYQALTLRYPDVPTAQLFAGEAMIRVGEFQRAREHFISAIKRHAAVRESLDHTVAPKLEAAAQASNDPRLWFQLAFVHEVLGRTTLAASEYRTVLELGISEPMASYASAAAARLGNS